MTYTDPADQAAIRAAQLAVRKVRLARKAVERAPLRTDGRRHQIEGLCVQALAKLDEIVRECGGA